jgi:hypothetical protein
MAFSSLGPALVTTKRLDESGTSQHAGAAQRHRPFQLRKSDRCLVNPMT